LVEGCEESVTVKARSVKTFRVRGAGGGGIREPVFRCGGDPGDFTKGYSLFVL
jgi:hypothetical protein